MFMLKVIGSVIITFIVLIGLLLVYFGIIGLLYLIIFLGILIYVLIPIIVCGGCVYLGCKCIYHLYKKYLQKK